MVAARAVATVASAMVRPFIRKRAGGTEAVSSSHPKTVPAARSKRIRVRRRASIAALLIDGGSLTTVKLFPRQTRPEPRGSDPGGS